MQKNNFGGEFERCMSNRPFLGDDSRTALGSHQDTNGGKQKSNDASGAPYRMESRWCIRFLPGSHSMGK